MGESVEARGRRFPLQVARPPATALVHVEINHQRPLRWTPNLRARVSAAILHHAAAIPARRVQVDFEVRASERRVLLDVLHDVRRGLPRGTILSMTALASWCDTEDWLGAGAGRRDRADAVPDAARWRGAQKTAGGGRGFP